MGKMKRKRKREHTHHHEKKNFDARMARRFFFFSLFFGIFFWPNFLFLFILFYVSFLGFSFESREGGGAWLNGVDGVGLCKSDGVSVLRD